MKRSRPDRGADAKAIKGLFRISRAGQDRFQELFFPSKPPTGWRRAFLEGMANVATTTDRWLANRRPA
jgi:hypothetical protein